MLALLLSFVLCACALAEVTTQTGLPDAVFVDKPCEQNCTIIGNATKDQCIYYRNNVDWLPVAYVESATCACTGVPGTLCGLLMQLRTLQRYFHHFNCYFLLTMKA